MLNYQRNYIIYRILDGFFRNWLVFLVTLVGVSGVVAGVLFSRGNKYQSFATIRFGGEEVKSIKMDAGIAPRDLYRSESYINAARFQDLMRDTMPGGFVVRVLDAAKLANPIKTDPRAEDPRLRELVESVGVSPLSDNVIRINLVWPDKDECIRIVEAMQAEFIRQAEIDSSAVSENTLVFLDEQIKLTKKRMMEAESALVAFKRDNSGLLPDALTGQIDALTTLRMQKDGLQVVRDEARLRLEGLRKRLAKVKPVSVLEQRVAVDPAMFELRSLYEQRAQRVRSGWLPTSPMVTEIDEKIKQVESDIRKRERTDPTRSRNVTESVVADNPEFRDIEQQIVEAEITDRTRVAQMTALDQQIGKYEAIISKLPAGERTLTEKTRDYKLLQNQFDDLIKRRMSVEIKRDLGVVTARSQYNPMNMVTAESMTSSKKKMISIAVSLAIGIVLALLLVIVREWMDPSIRYEMDAARMLELPVLVSLPETSQLRFPVRGKHKALSGRSPRALGGRA